MAQPGEKELLVNVPERAVALMKQANGFGASQVPGKLYSAKLRELPLPPMPPAAPIPRGSASPMRMTR